MFPSLTAFPTLSLIRGARQTFKQTWRVAYFEIYSQASLDKACVAGVNGEGLGVATFLASSPPFYLLLARFPTPSPFTPATQDNLDSKWKGHGFVITPLWKLQR